MIVLTDRSLSSEGHKVVVNEAFIERIVPHEQSGGCSIYMASGAIVVVGESAGSVLSEICGYPLMRGGDDK